MSSTNLQSWFRTRFSNQGNYFKNETLLCNGMWQLGFDLQKFFQFKNESEGKTSFDKKLIFDLTVGKLVLKRSICISSIGNNNNSNNNNNNSSDNNNNQFTSLHRSHKTPIQEHFILEEKSLAVSLLITVTSQL